MAPRWTSPTNETKKLLEASGWTVDVTERWIPRTRIRKDLFGFADLAAMRQGSPPMLLQATSDNTGGNAYQRIKKIRALDTFKLALEVGFLVVVVSWAQRGPRGQPKVWTPRTTVLTRDGERVVDAAAFFGSPVAVASDGRGEA